MLVEVTRGDADAGCRQNGSNCPVALAVMRASGFNYVMVTAMAIEAYASLDAMHGIHDGPMSTRQYEPIKRWATPAEAAQAIVIYDAFGVMEPFSFEL